MKKLTFLLLSAIAVCSQLQAQKWTKVEGNGNITTQNRQVGTFSEISVGGGMQVEVSQGSTHTLSIQADDNLLEYIVTEVNGSKLQIRYKNNVSVSSRKVKVTITTPRLDGAAISGSGSLYTTGSIPSNGVFDAAISGSGNLKIASGANEVKARISGSGDIAFAGNASALDVSISGSGSFKGFELNTREAVVSISGSGSVETAVNGKIDARIAGSGSVLYKGSAQVSMKTSGSGKVKKVD